MRILFIAPRTDESAGDAVYVRRLAVALLRKKVQVDVFAAKDGRFALLRGQGILQNQRCDDELYKHERGAIGNGIISKNFYSRRARYHLKGVLRKIKPDCIHIHGIHQFFTLSCMLELKQYGAPIVFTLHDYKIACGNASFFCDRTLEPCTKCLNGNVWNSVLMSCKRNSRIASLGSAVQMSQWRFSKAMDVVDKFLVGSRFVFDLLSSNDQLVSKLKLCRFPYPQLEDLVSRSNEAGIKLSFVGRLVSHKGVHIFARAVSDFQVPIHIFGNGELIESTRDTLKNNKNVTFHGWTGQREMAKYLSPGNIVMVPSLAYETFCYVVVEAMMRGCCVVASKRGGIAELIRDGQNGIIVDPPTREGFHDAVEALLADRNKIIALGRRAKRITTDLPDIDSHAEKVIEIYRALLGEGR